uniref:Uncharacterized protein n=1 Tax=Anopheles culicifacies TaxID=139723 RepID=A0A182MNM2_9DIPT
MLRKNSLYIALVVCMLSLGQARAQQTVEECVPKMEQLLTERLCEFRQYNPVEGMDMDSNMQCVMQVIGFVDESGDVEFQELQGLLKMADSSLDHTDNLKKCKAGADQVANTAKATKFYTCFMGTSSFPAFKLAVDYAELARKESTVEECEKNIAASLKDRVCELRQYTPVSSSDMDNHMQCVLEVVGFVNENGEVKENDLLALLQRVDSSVPHATNMRKCVTEASGVDSAKKANTFYTCFLGTSSLDSFKSAVDYNELLRAGKMQLSDPFDMGRVSTLIKEIDDGLC